MAEACLLVDRGDGGRKRKGLTRPEVGASPERFARERPLLPFSAPAAYAVVRDLWAGFDCLRITRASTSTAVVAE